MPTTPTRSRGPSTPEAGFWPARRTDILDWLMRETQRERYIDVIFVDLCRRLREGGMPIARAALHLRTDNPEWMGARILWRTGLDEAEIETFDYDVTDTQEYLDSPLRIILEGGSRVYQRFEPGQGEGPHLPLYDDLIAEGLTDYLALPLDHTLGKRHVVSFSADGPGGFSQDDLDRLADLLPALSLVSEIRLKNRLARTLLETYVGPHASEAILAGATRRGSGTTVGAAILICDLRDFTTISERWPRDDVIALLNDYFDAMSEPIERHGGEILKFIGDGLLAIFPLASPTACADLLAAVAEAQIAMRQLNEDHVARGRESLGYGIGVHVGDVMYGNIGSRRRLDFTVIGPAVNIASRLETLTKETQRPVLLSGAFVRLAACEDRVDRLGVFPLRGLGEPIEVFALQA